MSWYWLQEYHPNDGSITIRGERLDKGVGIGDYKVEIGTGICEVSSLSATELVCRPPPKEPEVANGSFTEHKSRMIPRVQVWIDLLLNLHESQSESSHAASPIVVWLDSNFVL